MSSMKKMMGFPVKEAQAMVLIKTAVIEARHDAEVEAWKSLRGYKFQMFGYWVGKWVGYNQCLDGTEHHTGNPFKKLVHVARYHIKAQEVAK